MTAFPKPRPGGRRREKARVRRRETKVVRSVRSEVAMRDGSCRLHTALFMLRFRDPIRWSEIARAFGPCAGRSEWAHFGPQKRARTRGMPPEARHTTAGSLMLCASHHDDGPVSYDGGTLHVCDLTANGCDGPLRFRAGGTTYEEGT